MKTILILVAVFIHAVSFSQWVSDADSLTTNNRVGVGLTNPNNLLQVQNLIEFNNSNYSTFIGYESGINNTANYNTFLGYRSGKMTTTGKQNVFIGYLAGTDNTTGKSNVFIGESAGVTNTTGNSNSFIGRKAGESNTVGEQNNFYGKESGRNNTIGSWNAALGCQSLRSVTEGYCNVSIGGNSLQNTTCCDSTVAIGFGSGGGVDRNYKRNVFIGFETAIYSGNISGCILLGSQAGQSNQVSNRLMIDNSNTNTPLIDGDFDKNIVTINDFLKIKPASTAPLNPTEGMLWADSVDHKLKYYDGTAWRSLF